MKRAVALWLSSIAKTSYCCRLWASAADRGHHQFEWRVGELGEGAAGHKKLRQIHHRP